MVSARSVSRTFIALAVLVLASLSQSAMALDQWANTLLGFSSQYSTGNWSAEQALGPSNTNVYGDVSTAWAPAVMNGTTEFLAVAFDVPVCATGATIRETCGNGFVSRVDVIGVDNVVRTVWTGTDSSPKGSPVNFKVNWAQTAYAVRGLKVFVNTSKDLNTWEEIDSIQLHGSVAHGPADMWADKVIDFSSEYSTTAYSAAQTLQRPNTPYYGDSGYAWAAASRDGTQEHVTVGFPVPVYANGVTVRETNGNGFLYRIDLLDSANVLHTVWSGTDPSAPDEASNTLITFPMTSYLVKGVRVFVDTNATADWEEIDAIRLHGVTSNFASFAVKPTSVAGGKPAAGTVTLSVPAPAGGSLILLSSGDTSRATVPASVLVPAGSKTASFTITTKAVTAANTQVTLSAAFGAGDVRTATLLLQPAAISSVSLTPASQTGGKPVTGKVTLTGAAPAGGIVVSLAIVHAKASLAAASVTVPEGALTATFTINTTPVTASTAGTVTGTYKGVTKSATLTIIAPVLSKLTLSPTSVVAGSPTRPRRSC